MSWCVLTVCSCYDPSAGFLARGNIDSRRPLASDSPQIFSVTRVTWSVWWKPAQLHIFLSFIAKQPVAVCILFRCSVHHSNYDNSVTWWWLQRSSLVCCKHALQLQLMISHCCRMKPTYLEKSLSRVNKEIPISKTLTSIVETKQQVFESFSSRSGCETPSIYNLFCFYLHATEKCLSWPDSPKNVGHDNMICCTVNLRHQYTT